MGELLNSLSLRSGSIDPHELNPSSIALIEMFELPPIMWPVLQPVVWPARCGQWPVLRPVLWPARWPVLRPVAVTAAACALWPILLPVLWPARCGQCYGLLRRLLRPELCGLSLVASAAFYSYTFYYGLRAVANAAACFGHCCRLRAAANPMLPVLPLARCGYCCCLCCSEALGAFKYCTCTNVVLCMHLVMSND